MEDDAAAIKSAIENKVKEADPGPKPDAEPKSDAMKAWEQESDAYNSAKDALQAAKLDSEKNGRSGMQPQTLVTWLLTTKIKVLAYPTTVWHMRKSLM